MRTRFTILFSAAARLAAGTNTFDAGLPVPTSAPVNSVNWSDTLKVQLA